MLHPSINRVPVDVWWTIFLEIEDINPSEVPSQTRIPLNLALVSTDWKNMVYNMPALWSTLHVKLSPGKTRKRIRSTNLWLTRAKTRPLTLSIDMLDLRKTKSTALYFILLPYLGRLKNLRLQVYDYHVFKPFAAAAGKIMPLLESAEFLVEEEFGYRDFEMNFDGSPLFRSLKMSMCNLSSYTFVAQMPLSQLTKLYVVDDCMCAAEVYKLLSACINLVDCTLHIELWGGTELPESLPASFTLPHLERYRLIFKNSPTPQIMKIFVFPSLKVLDLRITSELDNWNSSFRWSVLYTSLCDFQLRSNCPLEFLCIPCAAIKNESDNLTSPVDFFKIIPTLTSLHLVLHHLSSSARQFDPLEHIVSSRDFKNLPNLSHVHLEGIVNPNFLRDCTPEKIVLKEIVSHMILSRCPPSLEPNEQRILKSVKIALGIRGRDHRDDDDRPGQMINQVIINDLDETMVRMLRDKAPGLMVELEEV